MSHTYTASFLVELVNGTHDLDTDVLKMALFTDAVTLSSATTAYSTSGEASGTGYTAGGASMTLASGYPAAGATDNTYDFRFEDVEWTSASFTAYYSPGGLRIRWGSTDELYRHTPLRVWGRRTACWY
jgi:hypothetical protein